MRNRLLRNSKLLMVIIMILVLNRIQGQNPSCVVFHDSVGTFVICNNLIINNVANSIINQSDIPQNNIVGSSLSIMRDYQSDYRLYPGSSAVDMGDSIYITWENDFQGDIRIKIANVDVGAFELEEDDSQTKVYAVQQDSIGLLHLYNNIIINNKAVLDNVSIGLGNPTNLLHDTDNVFVNANNYYLKDNSPAVNAGDNQFIHIDYDIVGKDRRPCDGIVDQGAFELQPEEHSVSISAHTVMNETCNGHVTSLTATGGEHYTWSHSNETSATVIVNPLVPACYTVTAYVDGDCPWSDTATICIDPDELVENSMGSPSTEGKRFWVSFMKNYRDDPVLSLLISSQNSCSGLITNPNTGWSFPFSVEANQTTQVFVPNDQAYCSEAGQVSNYGLLVTSTENISLYASNFEDYTYDVTNILPETALSDEYVAQAYTPLKNTEFLIVATADSTAVEIVPACMTSDNHTAYVPYTVVLNQGQTYQVLSKFNSNGGDLSGSVVRSTDINKPIALFNGNVCANVPVGNRWCDHVVEQAFGIRFWGRNFVVTNTVGLPYDRVKVTASADNTKLYKDGVTIALINAHQSFEFELAATDTVCYLEASNACAAYLYMAGGELNPGDSYRGDPSMVWLSPLEQRIQEITFATFNSPNITNHNVNIVAPTASVETVMFDGEDISAQFHPVAANPMFSYARLDIPNGTHTLNSWGGVVAHVYGTGHCETYAYSVGSKAAVLSEQMFVNQILSSEMESNEFCTYEPINFDAVINYQCDSVLWNFGDGSENFSGYHFTHYYTQPGTYPVSMTVFLYDNLGQHCTTLYSQLEILDGYNVVWHDTVCQGDYYQGHDFEYVADTTGLVTLTRTVEIPDSECDSIYVVELFVNQRVFDYFDTICVGNEYNGYGLSLPDIEQGVYLFSDTVHRNPCDSITVLHLLVTPNTNDIYGIHGMEYVCLGNTYTYWLDTLSGMTDLEWTLPQGAYLLSGQGTDQVTITITEESVVGDILVSGQNACGSATYSLTLHSMPVYYTEIVDTVCGLGQPYHKFGFDIDSVTPDHQVFVQNLLSESCCDSTIVLSLVIIDMPDVFIQADTYRLCQNDAVLLNAICQTESLDWYDTLNGVSPEFLWNTNDTTQTVLFTSDTSMTVSVTVTNAYGCSVTVDTLMTIIQLTYAYDTVSVCENQFPFSYHDTVFAEGTETGEYEFVGMGNNGCDSLMHLYLEILPVTSYTIEDTILQQFLPYQLNDSLYTETGEYTQHFTNQYGCDSVLTLNLLVSENILVTIDSVVCDNEIPFEWNGALFEQADTLEVILQAENGADSIVVMQLSLKAVTYGDDYQTVCDSLTWIDGITYYESNDTVTYVLENAVGCDSIVTLHLTITYSTTGNDTLIACDSLTWINGVSYYESTDTATYVLTNAVGCDSVVTLHLTINYSTTGNDTLTACDSLTWINGVTYYESTDTATYVLTNAVGCDSVVTLHLMVNHSTTGIDMLTACDSLTWINGVTYYESTDTATYVLSNAVGCDSVVTLHLTINHFSTGNDTLVACDSLTWINGATYYESTDTAIYVLSNVMGCDSVVTLHLTINHSSTSIDEQTACDSLTWIDGVTYYESTDTATYVLSNIAGCDSIVTLHLTVNHATYGTNVLTACDSLTWIDGITYYESNDTATYTLNNSAGCDSIVTLSLTMYYPKFAQFADTTCDSYVWNDSVYTESGDFTQLLTTTDGCDSTVTLHLMVHHSTSATIDTAVIQNALPVFYGDSIYSAAGTYFHHFTNAAGCDSVITLHITVFQNVTNQVDTTICATDLPYMWHGHNYSSAGSHSATLLTSHGADSTVTYHLSVDNISANIGDITHITCYGESTGAATAMVTGGQAPMTYAWTNTSGTSVATTTSISNCPTGTYTFIVTDPLGCSATATVTLNTLNGELQPGTIAEDQVVCEGEQPLPFTGTAASGGDNGAYQWQISTNGSDWTNALGTNNAQTYSYPNSAATAFSLRRAWVSQSCGTAYSNTVTVEVAPNSSDTITAEVCQGESYQEYGFDIIMDQIAEAGDYMFEQHHATGHCDSAVILLLTVNPEVTEFVEATICEGEGYEADGFNVTPQETIGEEELTRVQNLQTVNGCDSVVTLQLTVIDTALRIEMLTEDFCEHNEAALTVISPMPNYVWSTGETATIIAVTSPGVYSVTASEGGCSTTAHIRVEGCQYELVLPNAITPSRGDGLNDCFYIPESFTANINLFKIYIFNRWGELVYYSTDKNFRWYGDYRDETQYQTIYNYVIEYTDTAGRPFRRTGSVTVL